MSEMAGTIAATDLIRGSFTPVTDIYEPEPQIPSPPIRG